MNKGMNEPEFSNKSLYSRESKRCYLPIMHDTPNINEFEYHEDKDTIQRQYYVVQWLAAV